MLRYYPWMAQCGVGLSQNVFCRPSMSTPLWMPPSQPSYNPDTSPYSTRMPSHRPPYSAATNAYGTPQRHSYTGDSASGGHYTQQQGSWRETGWQSGRRPTLPPVGLVVQPRLATTTTLRPPIPSYMSRFRPASSDVRNSGDSRGGLLGPTGRATGGNTEPLGPVGTTPSTPWRSSDDEGRRSPPLVDLTSPHSDDRQTFANTNTNSNTTMPPGVGKYIDRAYMAVGENDEEKNKVEMYLKMKLTPLLQSGAAWKVAWDSEPLPNQVNFETKPVWTPASQLRDRRAPPRHLPPRGGRNTFRDQRGFGQRRTGGMFGYQKERGPVLRSSVVRRDNGNRRDNDRRDNDSRRESDSRRDSESSGESPGLRRRRRRSTESTNGRTQSRESSPTSPPKTTWKTSVKKKKMKKDKKQTITSTVKWTMQGDPRRQQLLKDKRAERFGREQLGRKPRVTASRIGGRLGYLDDDDLFSPSYSPKRDTEEVDLSVFDVVGTCTDVEKPFFRLTTAPDLCQVRPPRILHVALEVVKRKYGENADYRYASDQLKSIRQDLTIQCHRTDFSVAVYETHARVALENGDREEFNQCQSQLKVLYKELPGRPNECEFTAYRLLYYVYMANTLDITTLLNDLTKEAKEDSCVAFALSVRRAWALQSYHSFFKLHQKAPRMCSYVIDWFLERERKTALTTMLRAYRPTVPLSFLSQELDMKESELLKWLETLDVKPMADNVSKIDCRLFANAKIS